MHDVLLFATLSLFVLMADLCPRVFFIVVLALVDSAHLNLAQSLLAPLIELLSIELFRAALPSCTSIVCFFNFELYLAS